MSKEISNLQIEDALENVDDDDIMENFIGVFPANHVNKYNDLKSMISEKILQVSSSDKDGTYWWSIIDIGPKTDLSRFDSFGIDGLKIFIIQDDESVIKKYHLELKKS